MPRWMPVYEDDMTHWLWDNAQRYPYNEKRHENQQHSTEWQVPLTPPSKEKPICLVV